MQAEEDFSVWFKRDVQPQLDALERMRRQAVKHILVAWLGLLVLGLVGWFALSWLGFDGEPRFMLVILIGVGGAVAVGWYRGDYRREFKHKVVATLVRAYDRGLGYQALESIGLEEFKTAGLFRNRTINEFSGEDLVVGKLGKTAIRFSEVRAVEVTERQSSGTTKRSERVVFSGLFFIADFNKHFSGSTYVLPDRAQKLFGALGQSMQSLQGDYGQLVKLEDPEFERLFVVYANDQIEARYVLSTALMARITEFRQRSGYLLHLAFVQSRLYVAIKTGKDLFEPRLFRSILNEHLYHDFWADLQLIAGLVEELNLNTRIWSKA